MSNQILIGPGWSALSRWRGARWIAFAAASQLAVPARAQSVPADLISAARAQLEAPNPDSAARLLESALRPQLHATATEQTRAWVLYGIAQLMEDNVETAHAAFRQALRHDPTLRVDSLFFFTGALEREFSAERGAVATGGAAPALAVMVRVPSDTVLPPGEGRWSIGTRPTFPARIVYTITPVDSQSTVVWSDTQAVGSAGTAWNLRSSSGAPIHTGRYVLRVTASDTSGQVAPTVERVLDVARLPYDTTPLPPPLPPSAFAPDSARVHPGSALWLLGGLALFAGVEAIGIQVRHCPSTGGSCLPSWTDPTALGVFGVSLIAFFSGRHTRRYPSNTERNHRLLADDGSRRVALTEANARARNAAPLRIRVEGASR